MPNVNLTDSRSRDAVVKAETTGVDEEVRYVDEEGKSAYTRKILKATVDHDFETLAGLHDGDAEALGNPMALSTVLNKKKLFAGPMVKYVKKDRENGLKQTLIQKFLSPGLVGNLTKMKPFGVLFFPPSCKLFILMA